MLTDAILRDATIEAERFLLSIVPEDGESHRFSVGFEEEMEKLIRRAKHPVRYQVMRTAAAVLLVIATLFGTLMAVSPEVRAAVVGWVKETFGGYSIYSNSDTTATEMYDYCLSILPDGYWEWKVIDSIGGKTCYYSNGTSRKIYFKYTNNVPDSNAGLFINSEDYKKLNCSVNGLRAELYIPLKVDELSVIVWQDPDTNTLLWICSILDREELINLAESVVRTGN